MQETTLSADRGLIFIYGSIHLFVSMVVFLLSAGWQMSLLDSGMDRAPYSLGYYIVFSLDLLLGLPVRSPMILVTSYLEIGDSIFNSFYGFVLIMTANSLLAAIAYDFISRWRQNRRSAI